MGQASQQAGANTWGVLRLQIEQIDQRRDEFIELIGAGGQGRGHQFWGAPANPTRFIAHQPQQAAQMHSHVLRVVGCNPGGGQAKRLHRPVGYTGVGMIG